MSSHIRFNLLLADGFADAPAGELLPHAVALAQAAERAGFENLIVPDVGTRGLYDPLSIVAALARATTRIRFIVGASTEDELPAVFARRLSSLDHFTGGRIGWLIETEGSPAGQAPGAAPRAGRAEEFLSVATRLWKESWEDGAVLRDRVSGRYADPEKVHAVKHSGPHFDLETIHLAEPSPQRIPLLATRLGRNGDHDATLRHADLILLEADASAAIRSLAQRARATRDDGFGILVELLADEPFRGIADRAQELARDELGIAGFALTLPPGGGPAAIDRLGETLRSLSMTQTSRPTTSTRPPAT